MLSSSCFVSPPHVSLALIHSLFIIHSSISRLLVCFHLTSLVSLSLFTVASAVAVRGVYSRFSDPSSPTRYRWAAHYHSLLPSSYSTRDFACLSILDSPLLPSWFQSAANLPSPPLEQPLLALPLEGGQHYLAPFSCKKSKMNWKNITKPCKKLLVSSGGASSGRNSAGRITIFHRGGGSKRLHRNVDLKRNTSSTGIVERIEYDPNRTSKIALVRWIEGVEQNKMSQQFIPSRSRALEPTTAIVSAQFPLACLSPQLITRNGESKINLSNNSEAEKDRKGDKISSLRGVFSAGLAPSGAKHVSSLLNFPRISVAGAKPGFFIPHLRGEVHTREEKEFSISDIQKWKRDSILWVHRSKRRAAFSWRSILRNDMSLGFVRDDGNAESKSEKEEGTLPVQRTGQKSKFNNDCVPISYILASNELEAGTLVMNCDASKSPRKQRA